MEWPGSSPVERSSALERAATTDATRMRGAAWVAAGDANLSATALNTFTKYLSAHHPRNLTMPYFFPARKAELAEMYSAVHRMETNDWRSIGATHRQKAA